MVMICITYLRQILWSRFCYNPGHGTSQLLCFQRWKEDVPGSCVNQMLVQESQEALDQKRKRIEETSTVFSPSSPSKISDKAQAALVDEEVFVSRIHLQHNS